MRLRNSTCPVAFAPCTWNTCFAMSKPIVVACSMGASLVAVRHRHLGTQMPSGGVHPITLALADGDHAFDEADILDTNVVISKRFAKRQQMQWTKRGAHLLLQTRTRPLDGTLRPLLERWYPGLAN